MAIATQTMRVSVNGSVLIQDSYIFFTWSSTILTLSRWHNGKESACQCRRCKRCGFDAWVRKTPGVGNGTPLQYSCLDNPMDRGAWWATVHNHKKSDISEHVHTHIDCGKLKIHIIIPGTTPKNTKTYS